MAGVRKLTDEQRLQRRRESALRCKWAKIEKVREDQARRGREKRAARAVAEGRPVGVTGAQRKLSRNEFRDRQRARSLAYWAKNPEKRKDLARADYLANKDKYTAKSHNRRARLRNAPGSHTAADIAALWDKQQGICTFCMQRLSGKVHVDHNVPIALGGSNAPDNLRLLHSTCNLMKGARHPAERVLSQRLCW